MSEKALAKDAKAGQWYEWQNSGKTRRVLCCRPQNVWSPDVQTIVLLPEEELTHLPDCTGWDWQPPKPEPKYRPFATWQEWWPHRDRWVRWGLDRMKFCWRGRVAADEHFKQGCVFLNDDGTDAEPFGVEVTE